MLYVLQCFAKFAIFSFDVPVSLQMTLGFVDFFGVLFALDTRFAWLPFQLGGVLSKRWTGGQETVHQVLICSDLRVESTG